MTGEELEKREFTSVGVTPGSLKIESCRQAPLTRTFSCLLSKNEGEGDSSVVSLVQGELGRGGDSLAPWGTESQDMVTTLIHHQKNGGRRSEGENLVGMRPGGCIRMGASVIKCCYAARGIPGSWSVTEVAGYTNTTATWSDIKKTILDEKISLNVSGLLVNPACVAGVLT